MDAIKTVMRTQFILIQQPWLDPGQSHLHSPAHRRASHVVQNGLGSHATALRRPRRLGDWLVEQLYLNRCVHTPFL